MAVDEIADGLNLGDVAGAEAGEGVAGMGVIEESRIGVTGEEGVEVGGEMEGDAGTEVLSEADEFREAGGIVVGEVEDGESG